MGTSGIGVIVCCFGDSLSVVLLYHWYICISLTLGYTYIGRVFIPITVWQWWENKLGGVKRIVIVVVVIDIIRHDIR